MIAITRQMPERDRGSAKARATNVRTRQRCDQLPPQLRRAAGHFGENLFVTRKSAISERLGELGFIRGKAAHTLKQVLCEKR